MSRRPELDALGGAATAPAPWESYLFSTDAYTPKTYRGTRRRAGVALWSRAYREDYVLRRRRVLSQSHRPGEGLRHLYHRPAWRHHHLERGVQKRARV